LTKETRSTLSEICHSATCSPQAPCGLPCDAHRTNASRKHIVFRTPSDATRDNTKSCIAKSIADLIVYLRNTSSQVVKKQGDFWGYFWQEKCNLWGRKHDWSRSAV